MPATSLARADQPEAAGAFNSAIQRKSSAGQDISSDYATPNSNGQQSGEDGNESDDAGENGETDGDEIARTDRARQAMQAAYLAQQRQMEIKQRILSTTDNKKLQEQTKKEIEELEEQAKKLKDKYYRGLFIDVDKLVISVAAVATIIGAVVPVYHAGKIAYKRMKYKRRVKNIKNRQTASKEELERKQKSRR